MGSGHNPILEALLKDADVLLAKAKKPKVQNTRKRRTEPWVSTDGHVKVYVGDKVKNLARVRVEEALGRSLRRTDKIQFKDGDKTNCNLDNLVLVSEAGVDFSILICPHCHNPFTKS